LSGAADIAAPTPSPTPDARRVALDLLEAVLARGQPLDQAQAGHRHFPALDPRDRGFARLLATAVLRRRGEIDARLETLLKKPLPDSATRARNALRLGAAQLLFLETPPHAAVHQTVALFGGRQLARYRGLANAVLRRLADTRAPGTPEATRLNTPDWLWDAWSTAYGDEVAQAIAAAHLTEAPLDITAARDPEIWRKKLEAELLPNGTLRRAAGGDPTTLPGFAEGAWWVQDAAAALPVRLLAARPGETVIDLCAAPGGKTAQLAVAGAAVTAVERAPARLKRMRGNLDRLGLDATLVAADACGWRPDDPADAVLLDAPCSATGTIRRHPDIAWLKTPDDVVRLTALQDRLLRAAVDMLRPGGRLVYATCSLQPEEGPGRIAALLATGAPVAPDPVTPEELPGLEDAILPDGAVRTLPCQWTARGGLDGFYIARLRRT
jgi:16S rRNA (cytosine967-C5)-methyltransferase